MHSQQAKRRRIPHEFFKPPLSGAKTFLRDIERGTRIDGGERFELSPIIFTRRRADARLRSHGRGYGWDDAHRRALRFIEERAEKIRSHRGHVHGEDEQAFALAATQRGGDSAERAAVGNFIEEDFDSAIRIWAVAFSRDENLRRLRRAQHGELALPERFAIHGQRGFVAAHARRLPTGEQQRGV